MDGNGTDDLIVFWRASRDFPDLSVEVFYTNAPIPSRIFERLTFAYDDDFQLPKLFSDDNRAYFSLNNIITKDINSDGFGDLVLVANYGFKGGNKNPIASFLFAFDINDLKQQLDQTRARIFTSVSILTLIVVVIALFIFQRSILCPLNKLSSHLHRVKEDKNYQIGRAHV